MSKDEIAKVESLVNEAILFADNCETVVTGINEARAMGAMALFGEKYGETVRVVKVGDFSIELCGGCHMRNSAQAGMFKILSESGVAAGIRRIEAATGMNTVKLVEHMDDMLSDVSGALKTTPEGLLDRVNEMHEQSRQKDKTIAELKQKCAGNIIDDVFAAAVEIEGVQTIITEVDGMGMDEMRNMSDMLKDRMGSGIVLLGTKGDGKVNFIATATKDVVKKGFHAGNLIKAVATIAGGGGGGRPDMAQAGGKKPEKLAEALDSAQATISEMLK
jgi:alanyl-tRNA synthetase